MRLFLTCLASYLVGWVCVNVLWYIFRANVLVKWATKDAERLATERWTTAMADATARKLDALLAEREAEHGEE